MPPEPNKYPYIASIYANRFIDLETKHRRNSKCYRKCLLCSDKEYKLIHNGL